MAFAMIGELLVGGLTLVALTESTFRFVREIGRHCGPNAELHERRRILERRRVELRKIELRDSYPNSGRASAAIERIDNELASIAANLKRPREP